jgi:REP element-mobilizing transposase RayT
MPDYRRNRVPGGTFFFTVNLLDGHSDLLVTQIDALRNAVRQVAAARPSASDYTHFKPVKHGLVQHSEDWPHSSFHRCVATGLYPAGWLGCRDEPQETGERF